MPYKNKSDATKYMREYRKKYPEKIKKDSERKTKLRHERKILAIKIKGGSCEICGYNKNLAALEFHHVNGKDINWNIEKNFLRWREDKFFKELDKCILVCSNCHQEIHYPDLNIISL